MKLCSALSFFVSCLLLMINVKPGSAFPQFGPQFSLLPPLPGLPGPPGPPGPGVQGVRAQMGMGGDLYAHQQQFPFGAGPKYQQMQHDVNFWDIFNLDRQKPNYFQPARMQAMQPNDLWYSSDTQIIGQPEDGIFSKIWRWIKGFFLALIPSPIRMLMGWY